MLTKPIVTFVVLIFQLTHNKSLATASLKKFVKNANKKVGTGILSLVVGANVNTSNVRIKKTTT